MGLKFQDAIPKIWNKGLKLQDAIPKTWNRDLKFQDAIPKTWNRGLKLQDAIPKIWNKGLKFQYVILKTGDDSYVSPERSDLSFLCIIWCLGSIPDTEPGNTTAPQPFVFTFSQSRNNE